jgi:hypothetical protein
VAALRGHGVPLSTMLSGNIWGRTGLAHQIAKKRLRKHAASIDANRRPSSLGVNANQQPQGQQRQPQQQEGNTGVSVSSGKRHGSIHAQDCNIVQERGKAACASDHPCVHRAVILTNAEQSFSERMAACRSFPLADIGDQVECESRH